MSDIETAKTTEQMCLDEQDLRRLLNMSECAMFVAKPGSQIELMYANERFYSLMQCTREEFSEIYHGSVMEMILPEDRQKIRNLIARQTAVGGKIQLEHRARRKDGAVIWVSVSAHPADMKGQRVYFASCLDITQSRRNLLEAYEAKRDAELISNSIPGGVIKLRMTDFKLLYANDGFYRLAGYSKEEYQINFGDYCDRVLYPTDAEMVKRQVKASVENRGLVGFEYRIISKTGDVCWSYVNGCRIDDDNGEPVYLCIIMDITKRKQLEKQFEEVAERSDIIAKFMRETTWTYDIATRVLSRGGNLDETYSNESILEGQFNESQLGEFLHPDDVERFRQALKRREEELGGHRGVYRMKDNHGEYRHMEVASVSVGDGVSDKPVKVYGITRVLDNALADSAEAEIAAASNNTKLSTKLMRIAKSSQAKFEDTLTGMIPYAKFLDKAREMLAERTDDKRYALMCADIDEFRKFSHHYGFSISNEILLKFSRVLQKFVERGGLCARVDGDYFVAIFPYQDHKTLLKKLSRMMHYQDEITNGENQIGFDTTNGLYLVEPTDNELGDMLEKADLARRSIKGIKGNHYAIYTDDLQQERFREERIIQEILDAMEKQTVEICYLPRIQGDKENVVGCTAVARIQMQDGQYLETDGILHYIERGGRLDKFSYFLLNQVCCSFGARKAKGLKTVPLAIQMTASQLSARNALSMIENIVEVQNKMDPSDLIIEVHERYFADMTSALQVALEQLCKRGYQIVISRFASHHTALHSLRTIPVKGIKFHAECFTGGKNGEREKTILKNIVIMAKELGMTVYCGGIHTKLQEEYAREIGCDMLEGEIFYGAMRNNVFEKCFLQ